MPKISALSDIHAHASLMAIAVNAVDLEGNPSDEFLLLGDLIDRGPDSAECLYLAKDLVESFPGRVTMLLGNHEIDFIQWLDDDDGAFDWLTADTGLVTVRSFLDADELERAIAGLADDHDSDALTRVNGAVKSAIKARHGALLAWLRKRPLHYETAAQIFVHAGIEEDAGEEWKLFTADHVFTGKWPATFGAFHKTIVAGHVGTSGMHRNGSHEVFFDGESHYYIDGSVESTGVLNVLTYDTESKDYGAFTVGQ